jgi:hypothetical protein
MIRSAAFGSRSAIHDSRIRNSKDEIHSPSRPCAFFERFKRHNEREWFRARKAQYDSEVRLPMISSSTPRPDFRSFARSCRRTEGVA